MVSTPSSLDSLLLRITTYEDKLTCDDIRRDLTSAQKQDYIAAVKCLQNTAGLLGKYWSGARSRFDDYVATHINLTEYVHFTVSRRADAGLLEV